MYKPTDMFVLILWIFAVFYLSLIQHSISCLQFFSIIWEYVTLAPLFCGELRWKKYEQWLREYQWTLRRWNASTVLYWPLHRVMIVSMTYCVFLASILFSSFHLWIITLLSYIWTYISLSAGSLRESGGIPHLFGASASPYRHRLRWLRLILHQTVRLTDYWTVG